MRFHRLADDRVIGKLIEKAVECHIGADQVTNRPFDHRLTTRRE